MSDNKELKGMFVINAYLKSKKFDELYEMIEKAAIDNNISLTLFSNADLPVSNFDEAVNELSKNYDFVIFWDKDILLAKYLEAHNMKVINSSNSIEICDDKAKTHFELLKAGIICPKTIVAPMTYDNIGYTNFDFLNNVANLLKFPVVVKERQGSFGMQVYLANDMDELKELVVKHGHNKLIFQEFIKTDNNSDIRVNMVGDKVCTAMKRTAADNDFRSNITNGGTMEKYSVTPQEELICKQVMAALKLDYAGIDLLKDTTGKVYVCEVNSNAHFKNIYDCTKVNCADILMKYIKKKAGDK